MITTSIKRSGKVAKGISPRASGAAHCPWASLHPEKYCKGEVITWQDGLKGIPLRIIDEAVEKLNPQLWDSQMTSFEKASCSPSLFSKIVDCWVTKEDFVQGFEDLLAIQQTIFVKLHGMGQ